MNDEEGNRGKRRGIEEKRDRGDTGTYRLLSPGRHSGTIHRSNLTRILSCASDPRVPTSDQYIISSVQPFHLANCCNSISVAMTMLHMFTGKIPVGPSLKAHQSRIIIFPETWMHETNVQIERPRSNRTNAEVKSYQ